MGSAEKGANGLAMPRDIFTSRSGSGGYRPLQFESTLSTQIGRPLAFRTPRSRRSPKAVMAALLAAVILTGIWAWSHTNDEERALARMATAVFTGLHGGAAPDSVAAAGFGLGWLTGDTKALAESGESATIDAFNLHKSLVEKIRTDLQAAGVKWENARPLAFGGVRAQVADPSSPPEPVTAVTGNVYFAANGKVYALEISAERIGDAYVATDIWQCVGIKTNADNLKSLEAHAKAGYTAFMAEQPDAAQSGQIVKSEPVFIAL